MLLVGFAVVAMVTGKVTTATGRVMATVSAMMRMCFLALTEKIQGPCNLGTGWCLAP